MFQQAARPKRAADLIRERNRQAQGPTSVAEVRAALTGGRSTGPTADTPSGKERGLELRQNIAAGNVPPRTVPRVDREQEHSDIVRRKHFEMQGRSPLFLEALKRKLAGDKIGGLSSPRDFDKLEALEQFAKNYHSGAVGRRLEKVKAELQGQVGFLRRQLLRMQQAGLSVADAVTERAKDIIADLQGDSLKRKLAGMGLLPPDQAPTEPIDRPGYRSYTPRQGRPMVAVESSNVAALAWEPFEQEHEFDENALGTLRIAFVNRWEYKYEPIPRWVYTAILRSPSKGRAVWVLLRKGLTPDSVPYGNLGRDGYERAK